MASLDLASLVVSIKADVGDAVSGIQQVNQKLDTINNQTDKVASTTESAASKMANSWTEVNSQLQVMQMAFEKVGKPLMDFMAKGIQGASDLAETVSKTQQIFGSSSDAIMEWSETALDSMGMAQNSALTMASTFGDLATSIGLPVESAKEMSMNLTQLAADLASFKNIGSDQAAQALQGIFTGNAQSLKSLGIVMNEATLSAYALSQGITTNISAMSEAEKVQLRYQYVLQATANAQGDFQRTSTGFANASRRVSEGVDELTTSLGEALMPLAEGITNAIADVLNIFNELPDGIKTVTTAVIAATAAFTVAIPIIKGITVAWGAMKSVMSSGLSLVIPAIAAATVGLAVLVSNLAKTSGDAEEAHNSVTQLFDELEKRKNAPPVEITTKVVAPNKEQVKSDLAVIESYINNGEGFTGAKCFVRVGANEFTETSASKVVEKINSMLTPEAKATLHRYANGLPVDQKDLDDALGQLNAIKTYLDNNVRLSYNDKDSAAFATATQHFIDLITGITTTPAQVHVSVTEDKGTDGKSRLDTIMEWVAKSHKVDIDETDNLTAITVAEWSALAGAMKALETIEAINLTVGSDDITPLLASLDSYFGVGEDSLNSKLASLSSIFNDSEGGIVAAIDGANAATETWKGSIEGVKTAFEQALDAEKQAIHAFNINAMNNIIDRGLREGWSEEKIQQAIEPYWRSSEQADTAYDTAKKEISEAMAKGDMKGYIAAQRKARESGVTIGGTGEELTEQEQLANLIDLTINDATGNAYSQNLLDTVNAILGNNVMTFTTPEEIANTRKGNNEMNEYEARAWYEQQYMTDEALINSDQYRRMYEQYTKRMGRSEEEARIIAMASARTQAQVDQDKYFKEHYGSKTAGTEEQMIKDQADSVKAGFKSLLEELKSDLTIVGQKDKEGNPMVYTTKDLMALRNGAKNDTERQAYDRLITASQQYTYLESFLKGDSPFAGDYGFTAKEAMDNPEYWLAGLQSFNDFFGTSEGGQFTAPWDAITDATEPASTAITNLGEAATGASEALNSISHGGTPAGVTGGFRSGALPVAEEHIVNGDNIGGDKVDTKVEGNQIVNPVYNQQTYTYSYGAAGHGTVEIKQKQLQEQQGSLVDGLGR